MKVCLLNTFDRQGGAARACLRLYRGLRGAGADATLLVREKSDGDASIRAAGGVSAGRIRDLLDYLPLKLYPHRQPHNFSRARMPSRICAELNRLSPDIVHLHWIPQGLVSIEALAGFQPPIVWTLHDSWPFTGGCHLPGECRHFEEKCGRCPVLGSDRQDDLSLRVWERKRRKYPLSRMTIVAPSRWMADRAQASSLLQGCPVEVIPNGVDTEMYSPGDRNAARNALDLPQDRKIILFGAKNAYTDHNKGGDLLNSALGHLPPEVKSCTTLVVFGDAPGKAPRLMDVPIIERGVIEDEATLVDLYRSADLLVLPSRQENLPNMLSEAMSCAVACAAFAVGGIPEQLIHRETGVVAKACEPEALAAEITAVLKDTALNLLLAQNAREHIVKKFALERVVHRHLELYQRISEV